MLVVDPWHWLDEDGHFLVDNQRLFRRMLRIARFIEYWDVVREALGLKLTWYEATRHSFVSRCLANGGTLDEVSSAVGHSSPVVTRRYYDHFVRRTFTPALRAGLGLAKTDANVIPLVRPTRTAKA